MGVEPLAVAKMPTVGLIAAASSAPADKLIPVIEQAMPALGDLSYVPVCTDAGPCNALEIESSDDVAVGAALAQDVYALVSESLQTETASPKRSEKGLHGK